MLEPKANLRTKAALEVLLPYKDLLSVYTVNDAMGENTAKELGFTTEVIYHSECSTTSSDTELAAQALQQLGC